MGPDPCVLRLVNRRPSPAASAPWPSDVFQYLGLLGRELLLGERSRITQLGETLQLLKGSRCSTGASAEPSIAGSSTITLASSLAVATRQVRFAHEAGALALLPHTLGQLVGIHLRNGELVTAAALMQEVDAGVDATGGELSLYSPLAVAAYRGQEGTARALIDAGNRAVGLRGGGIGLVVVQWARTLLYNGLGRYEDAVRAALHARDDLEPVGKPPWTLPELVEAAARGGAPEDAADAFRRLSEMTQVSATEWALGLEARSRALLSDGDGAERLYREAIERLAAPGSRVDLARAHLLYGEWLRRERRRLDAREQLRAAHEMLSAMGVQGFADRAARELAAIGETARKRAVEASHPLTAQETQVARLARDGLSNPEIGARLLISPRTVEYHLHKVFAKLDISSRTQLGRVLAGGDADAAQPG
jgi:DNA-binding CsgD family transcriptional regulator